MDLKAKIKERVLSIGFTHFGVCSVDPGEEVPYLRDWLDQNRHGEMRYLENPRRLRPDSVLPNVRTMIVVGLNYRWPEGSESAQEGMISKYAWAADYHLVMGPMLKSLCGYVEKEAYASATKAYVDTGPVAEKYWAQKAGVGWIGKHTNVINTQGSSWFFLGVVLTDLDLPADPPGVDRCGTCDRCIEACPTRAITAPYMLDARLCISYLTIELRGSIPEELRAMIGNRIFGCDDCQDVCPWNRFARVGDPRFTPRTEALAETLSGYLQMTAGDFKRRFAGTNVLRAKYRGFLRNCLVAAGNSGRAELIPEIERHLQSEDAMIREHAQWALDRIHHKDTGAQG